jgi:hypothetical protein
MQELDSAGGVALLGRDSVRNELCQEWICHNKTLPGLDSVMSGLCQVWTLPALVTARTVLFCQDCIMSGLDSTRTRHYRDRFDQDYRIY